jgi:UrcA family protein
MTKFLALALLAVAATPAIATETARTAIVRVSDLNLASPAGVAALDQRLNRAARSVCDDAGVRTAFERRDATLCRSEALARVRPNRDAMVASARGTEVAIVATK